MLLTFDTKCAIMKLYKENFKKNTLQKVVNDMEKEKVLIIEQACREYNISPTDLVSFIHALGKISEQICCLGSTLRCCKNRLCRTVRNVAEI